jgi:hypothetical protein
VPEGEVPMDNEEEIVPKTYEEKISHEVLRNRHFYSRPSQATERGMEEVKPPMTSSSQMPLLTENGRTSQENSQASGSKRPEAEDSVEIHNQKKRRLSEIVDYQEGKIMKDGNAYVREDWATVRIEDVSGIGEDPINIASWVVIEEPTKWSYYKPTMRPASLLCEALEDQFQKGIGCVMHKLCFEKEDGDVSETYFEHDLRGKPWVQRKYSRPDKEELLSTKRIYRILFQGSKEFEEP